MDKILGDRRVPIEDIQKPTVRTTDSSFQKKSGHICAFFSRYCGHAPIVKRILKDKKERKVIEPTKNSLLLFFRSNKVSVKKLLSPFLGQIN